MKTEKINSIIEQENEEREAQAGRKAREIINAIIRGQEQIAGINKSIDSLRAELKALEYNPVDVGAILGG